MTAVRRIGWLVPIVLAALTATLVAALIVARNQRPSRALEVASPSIVNAGRGAPPEIAAINAQLAQIAALRANALYGQGLTHIVRGPVASLRPALGEEWRELGAAVGRAYVRPTGPRSRYFEVSTVAVARHGPARLELLTSEGQRVVQSVGTDPFQLINVGPLLAPTSGGVGLALSSLRPNSAGAGPNLILSPLQAEYLAPGEWVTTMPALDEPGPGGLRGLYLERGSATRFAMTPGVKGACTLAIQGAGVRGSVELAVTVGSQVRRARMSGTPRVVAVGPFSQAAGVISVSVTAATPNASLFVSKMQLVAATR
jgi:hypothetical protein